MEGISVRKSIDLRTFAIHSSSTDIGLQQTDSETCRFCRICHHSLAFELRGSGSTLNKTRVRALPAENRHDLSISGSKLSRSLIRITQPFSQGGKGIACRREAICLNSYRSGRAGLQAVEVIWAFPRPLIVDIVSFEG